MDIIRESRRNEEKNQKREVEKDAASRTEKDKIEDDRKMIGSSMKGKEIGNEPRAKKKDPEGKIHQE